jgi:HPr kinase/phosphorylase
MALTSLMMQVHGTGLSVGGIGVLLRGPPGTGKSDLALRLIDGGAKLVSDDQTILESEAGQLRMSSTAVLEGLLEVRGVGIFPVPCTRDVHLGLVVDLLGPRDRVERMPEKEYEEVLGVRVRRVRLHGFMASAPAKVRVLVKNLELDPAPGEWPRR